MSALASRIKALKSAPEPEQVRLLVLDSMTPGQRLALEVPIAFVDQAEKVDTPLVWVGRARPGLVKTLFMDGLQVLSHGVECSVAETQRNDDGSAAVVLVAGRYCELVDVGDDDGDSSWLGRRGRVRWLSLEDRSSPEEQATPALLARSEALEALVVEWVKLVRETGRERQEGQLERVLQDLGTMPDAASPSARALWIAGLINPLPGLGVAFEIRPAVLMAETADLKLQAVEMGLRDSIERLGQAGPPF